MREISKIILILLLLTGCVTQKQQPRILITHVLAVTEQGDTRRLPINMIRPNVVYKIINYGNNYRPYHSQWDYIPRHNFNQNIYVKPNNNNSNNNNIPTKPRVDNKNKDISRIELKNTNKKNN